MDDQQKPLQDGSYNSQGQQPSVTPPQFSQPGAAPQPGSQQPGHLYYDTAQGGGMVGGAAGKHGNKRKLFAIAGVSALVVLMGGGYVFGYYLPNKPENVFNTALQNTGKGYDELVKYASNDDVAKKFKNFEADVTFKGSGGGFSTDGKIKAHSDGKNSTFSGDVGLATTRLTFDGVVKDADNSDSPDLFFKVGGIKGMGSLYGVPGLDSLDNQWITIDHSLLDTYGQQLSAAQGLDTQDKDALAMPKEQDVVDAANVLGKEADKYLFSTDDSTAVLKNDSFVGKETVDGKATNHYKVSANKDHLKAFAKELGTELDKTNLSKWTKEHYKKSLSEVLDTKSMEESADKVKSSDKFDLWVNTKTKLVHKVRFSDKKDAAKNYYEFGLNYAGGPEKPFFFTLADNKDGVEGKGTFGLTLNTDTNVIKFNIDGADEGDDGFKLKLNATYKPSTAKVDAKAPEGAMSLNEAMSAVGLGDYMSLLDQQAQTFGEDLSADSSATDPFTISL
jgi:hypothetical protein